MFTSMDVTKYDDDVGNGDVIDDDNVAESEMDRNKQARGSDTVSGDDDSNCIPETVASLFDPTAVCEQRRDSSFLFGLRVSELPFSAFRPSLFLLACHGKATKNYFQPCGLCKRLHNNNEFFSVSKV